MSGWVYIITNKAMPGIIKIGFSTRLPTTRAAELNHTGSPHPYIVDYEIKVERPRFIEKKTHYLLRNRREGKEWFRCSVEEGIAAIKTAVGTKIHTERFWRADREKAEIIRLQEEEQRKNTAILETKRREIFDKYEKSLQDELPKFWPYFIGIFIILTLLLSVIVPGITDLGASGLSALGTFIITPFIHGKAEDNKRKSQQYQRVLAYREEELKNLEKGTCNHSSTTKQPKNNSGIVTSNSKLVVQTYCTECKYVFESEIGQSAACPNCKHIRYENLKAERDQFQKRSLEKRKMIARKTIAKNRSKKRR